MRQIVALFQKEFLAIPEGWRLQGYDLHSEAQRTHGRFRLADGRREMQLSGEGQGLIEALVDAVSRRFGLAISVVEFDEHAMSPGTEAKALASVTIEAGGAGERLLHRRGYVARVAAGGAVRDRSGDRGAARRGASRL